MSGFFEEVRRRKVYRVAVAYVVAAGFVIQIASATFPAWELPNWSLRLVIVLCLLGFPAALILAWAFDVTPRGIEVTPQASATTHRRRNLLTLALGGVVVSALAGFFLLPRMSARHIDKSVAVLPFQNLSSETENAYFADGIQDEILTNLAKIADLKVISRASVRSYRGDTARNAREIGKALGVATFLEGSVRRSGNRVRVSVQLINAANDEHIWAEDYDRELTDVFAIQTDLARNIATALGARLSAKERERLNRQPTSNTEAYLVYLQACDLANQPDHLRDQALQAEEFFEQAIKLDPNFAEAFAGLSLIQSRAYHTFDPTPSRRARARSTANEALRLKPDLPEGHLALGFFYYYGDRDYERALAEFEIASHDLPNESEAFLAIGAIQRRQGKWRESTANLERSVALDPKNVTAINNLAQNYCNLRDFPKGDETLNRALAAAPHSLAVRGMKTLVAISWKGDLDTAEREWAVLPPGADPQGLVTLGRVHVLTLRRRFPEALRVVEQFPGSTLTGYSSEPYPKAFLEGALHRYAGDLGRAQAAFERARVAAEQAVRESPDDAHRRGLLGQVLAHLGEKEAAIVEGKRAAELLPEAEDAVQGPDVTAALAQIYTWTGEHDEAFRLLEHLLVCPAGLSVPLVRLDPAWDPLRSDARFQQLLEKYAPKV